MEIIDFDSLSGISFFRFWVSKFRKSAASYSRAIKATGVLTITAGATAVTSTAANGAGLLEGGDLPEFIFADALEDGASGSFVEVLLRR
ncbi:hypothetical protein NAC44_17655 [Allorhizobium sp. BGMRC 0089]|uniref:hypothetical protein n=1 Tax=Allorhizobium sonneratiae TaxID=2934936 RepID=UPI002033B0D6|nr:hypothetical protein [Allorhizobium sonneratiae]MCM2294156.1 hypothetical protein [Allorhizobium sonneratiae]